MGTPLRAAANSWATGHCTAQRAVIHTCVVEVGPLELGSVVALRPVTSTPISTPLLWKEKGVGSLWVHFFFFFAKGLLSVSELWLSPPELSL